MASYSARLVTDAIALDVDAAVVDGVKPEERTALALVAHGCLNETVANACLERTLAVATHRKSRAALRELLGDEIVHARTGWAFVGSREFRPFRAVVAAYLATMLRATLRVWMGPKAHVLPEGAHEYGVLSLRELAVAHEACRDAALFGVAVGVVDLVVTRWSWMKRLRMGKDEVKREYKESEGDPQLKAARERTPRDARISDRREREDRCRRHARPSRFRASRHLDETRTHRARANSHGGGMKRHRLFTAIVVSGLAVTHCSDKVDTRDAAAEDASADPGDAALSAFDDAPYEASFDDADSESAVDAFVHPPVITN